MFLLVSFFQTYFKNTQEAVPVTIKNCDVLCPLEDFITNMGPVLLTEEKWNEECGETGGWLICVLAGLILLCIAITLCCFMICCFFYPKMKKPNI